MFAELWFDVGIKRYTTKNIIIKKLISCGLMQESKDIQPRNTLYDKIAVVV